MTGTDNRPIGMFDSGFGGLTVARAVIDVLPSEDFVYIGDTGRYPYGPRPAAEVRGFARELAWSLVKTYQVIYSLIVAGSKELYLVGLVINGFPKQNTYLLIEQLHSLLN